MNKKMGIFSAIIFIGVFISIALLFVKISLSMLLLLVVFYVIDYRNRKYPQEYIEYQTELCKNAGIKNTPQVTNFSMSLKIALTLIFLFSFICFSAIESYKPNYQIAYVNQNLKVGKYSFKKYDQIKVDLNSKDKKTIMVNVNGRDIKRTELTNIVFANTPEYQKLKEVQKQEQIARQKLEKKLDEKIGAAFYQIDLSNYEHSFYINPVAWALLTYDKKEILFNYAVLYSEIKCNEEEKEASVRTKIRSSANKDILAEYGVTGIKLK